LTSLDKICCYYISDFTRKQKIELLGKHLYFRDGFDISRASRLGSHPEASGHESKLYWQVWRASRGISGFSSLAKIHGLTNQLT